MHAACLQGYCVQHHYCDILLSTCQQRYQGTHKAAQALRSTRSAAWLLSASHARVLQRKYSSALGFGS